MEKFVHVDNFLLKPEGDARLAEDFLVAYHGSFI